MMAFRFSIGCDHHPLLLISRIMLMMLITTTLTSDLTITERVEDGRTAEARPAPAGSMRLSSSLCIRRFMILDSQLRKMMMPLRVIALRLRAVPNRLLLRPHAGDLEEDHASRLLPFDRPNN
jgi:hypothetical protein